jgi:hypothetical protein
MPAVVVKKKIKVIAANNDEKIIQPLQDDANRTPKKTCARNFINVVPNGLLVAAQDVSTGAITWRRRP